LKTPENSYLRTQIKLGASIIKVKTLPSEGFLKTVGFKITFLAFAFLVEFGIVQLAVSTGVSDQMTINLGGFIISPLLHILPLIVILILTLSWLYFNEALTVGSYRKKRETEKKSTLKEKGGKISKISWFFSKISFPEGLKKKVIENATFKGAFLILVFSLVLALLTYLAAYPSLLNDVAYSFLKSNTTFLNFLVGIRNLACSIGEFLSPLGWFASSIDAALKGAAPGLRGSVRVFDGLIGTLASLDANSKYILCQNLAAWIPALSVLAYGRYVLKPRIVKVKRRKR